MKIQIASDLHVEFGAPINNWLIEPIGDVLVIAGDLHVGLTDIVETLYMVSDHVRGIPIVYVPGNHEFYDSNYEMMRGGLAHKRPVLEERKIYLLDRASVVLEDILFIGATGWTDGSYLAFEPHVHYRGVRDLAVIGGFASANGGQTWGQEDIDYVRTELDLASIEKKVVVTHHAPTSKSLADRFRGDPMNAFFINNWADVIETGRPKLWVHGHCHDSFNYQAFETRVVCNPFGYWMKDENFDYRNDLHVEL